MKNPIIGVIAIVIIIAAVAIIVWQSIGSSSSKPGVELGKMVFICSNKECNNQFTVEGSGVEEAGAGMQARKCPKCGKMTAYRADQCPHCHKYFLSPAMLGEVPKGVDITKCPKCGKSLIPGK